MGGGSPPIPSSNWGEVQFALTVPTLGDRLIQQALNQVLQPLFDPYFSVSSFGFRPGRNAHQAVQAAQGYVAAGKRWTVDLDLEKFFDRVNHDALMARVGRKVEDEAGVETDPALSGSGHDGRRGSEHADGGHASGQSSLPTVIEILFSINLTVNWSEERASSSSVCGRLQHLCPKPTCRPTADGGLTDSLKAALKLKVNV